MLEAMMRALGPPGFGPGIGSGVPDCNSYNPQLAFNAILGKTDKQAGQMVTSDATTQILEHELDSKVNFVDYIIKETAITDRSGRQVTKKTMWSEGFGGSIQSVTNMTEYNGQVWEMTNATSDRVVNTPGESWHLTFSPGEREEHRVMLFHKDGDDLVREYFITLRSPRKTIDRLFENITGQKLAMDQSISDVIVSRREDQGETSITPRDIYHHFTNALDRKERATRLSFLHELKKDAYLSEKDLEIRSTQVAELVSKKVKEILNEKPSLEALGLVAQSIPKWTEMIKDATSRKVLDESAKRDLITRIARSDLIIKPETDYRADDAVVLAQRTQGLLLAIPTDKESIYHHQDNKYLPERKKARETRKQAFLSEKEEKSIEAVVAPLVIPAISYILDHTNPPQQASVLNQDISFVNHSANSLTLKDAIQQPLGLLGRCKPNEERYIGASSAEPGQKSEGAIVDSIALASLVLMGLLAENGDKEDQKQGSFRELEKEASEEGLPFNAKKSNVELADKPLPELYPSSMNLLLSPLRFNRGYLKGVSTAENLNKLSISNMSIGEENDFLSETPIISIERQRDQIGIVQEALRTILAFSVEEMKETKPEQEKEENADMGKIEREIVGLGREIVKTLYSKKEISWSLFSALVYREIKKLKIRKLSENIPAFLMIINRFRELPEESIVSNSVMLAKKMFGMTKEMRTRETKKLGEFTLDNLLLILYFLAYYYLIFSKDNFVSGIMPIPYSVERLPAALRVKKRNFNFYNCKIQSAKKAFLKSGMIYDRLRAGITI